MYASKYSFLLSPAVSLPSNPDTRAFSLLTVFFHAYQFNGDVSKWDVSKVSTMHASKYSFLPPLLHCPPILTRVPLTPRSVPKRPQIQQQREQLEDKEWNSVDRNVY